MTGEHYVSPSLEETRLDAQEIMVSSPLENEGITSSGGVLEWEW